MANAHEKKKLSRRGALSIISGSVCAAIGLPTSGEASVRKAVPVPGIPVVESGASVSASGVFTQSQMETIAALAEAVIPTDKHSPGAKAARVDQYIDEIIGASDQATKEFWINNLSAIGKLAQGRFGAAFSVCSLVQQTEVLQTLSLGESHPATSEEHFFVAIKRATIDGYYNSEVGIHQDLQYQGNDVLAEFNGCTHASHTPPATPNAK